MSSYEDYTRTSRDYDETRHPVGGEILIGCMAYAPAPLERTTILDAGCGTGSYSRALIGHVGRIEAVDLNPGMIEVATRKLAEAVEEGRISFRRSPIDGLPFADATFDGVMINQVLHHLSDDPATGFPAHRRTFEEFARVLKPGGVLTVNTCSQEQLRHGFWYYNLIPEAAETVRQRFAPLDQLIPILDECGFEYQGRFAPVDARIQGNSYLDPRGPLSEAWRNGDSTWALASEEELENALSRVRVLDEKDGLEDYVARNDASRQNIGQVTILSANRRHLT